MGQMTQQTEETVTTEQTERESRAPKQLSPWKPGQSGNPLGKPKGTRDRVTLVSKAIMSAIDNKYGSLVKFIEGQLEEHPLEVFKLLVKLQPKQTEVSGTTTRLVFNVAPYDRLPSRVVAEQIPNEPAQLPTDAT